MAYKDLEEHISIALSMKKSDAQEP